MRLIDAEEAFCNDCAFRDKCEEVTYCVFKDTPTIDAVPVVHGRCDYCKDGRSFIGQTIMLANDGKCHTIHYCPNCGAKMDAEG